MKFLFAFKYLAVFYQAFLPQQFMLKDSGFSFKLFKWYIDCFSFMCKLITMVGSNFLHRCKKIPWGREVMEWKPQISFQSIGIKSILYNFILIGIFFSEILKKERDKPLLEELANVHPWHETSPAAKSEGETDAFTGYPWAEAFWQIPTTETNKMLNNITDKINALGMGAGDVHVSNWQSHYKMIRIK